MPDGIEDLFQKIKEYADLRYDLFRLKWINKISGIISSFLTMIIMGILLGIIIICITIGLALLLGEWLGKLYYGFFIMGGLYLLAGFLIYSMRDKLIKRKVSNKLIKELIE